LLPAAKQQIPRATKPRFGMAILFGVFTHNTDMKTRPCRSEASFIGEESACWAAKQQIPRARQGRASE